MNLLCLPKRFLCLVLALGLLVLPLVALAGDVDPNGDKLRNLKNDPKYQAALMKQGATASNTNWVAICACEGATGIGGLIWGARAQLDHCKDKYSGGDIFGYCVVYSQKCDHYHWKSNCLKEQSCPPIPPFRK